MHADTDPWISSFELWNQSANVFPFATHRPEAEGDLFIVSASSARRDGGDERQRRGDALHRSPPSSSNRASRVFAELVPTNTLKNPGSVTRLAATS